MTKDQKIIRAKAGLLELAKQLGNVCQACKIIRLFQPRQASTASGALRQRRARSGGPMQELSRRKPFLKNRAAPEVEAAVGIAMAIDQPAYGARRAFRTN